MTDNKKTVASSDDLELGFLDARNLPFEECPRCLGDRVITVSVNKRFGQRTEAVDEIVPCPVCSRRLGAS